MSGFLGVALTAVWALAGFSVVSTHEASSGALVRTETVVQMGPDERNRFIVHHVRRRACSGSRASFLLSPPLGGGFRFYELTQSGDYADSFAGYLAQRGIEVWGYSPPTTMIAPGACTDGSVDCSVMAEWGIEHTTDHLDYIRHVIRRRARGGEIFIGGHSFGAITAMSAVGRRPSHYDGLFVSEGALTTDDPAIRSLNEGLCQQYSDAIAAGGTYGDLSGIKAIAALAAAAPDEPSPIPDFAGLTNHQVLVAVFANPALSPILAVPDFVSMAGDVAADEFDFASEAMVQQTVGAFNAYFPLRQLRDVSCSLAGSESFTGRMRAYRGAVYTIEAGLAFGPYMDDTLSRMPRARLERHSYSPLGHIDPWVAEFRPFVVHIPVHRWVARHTR